MGHRALSALPAGGGDEGREARVEVVFGGVDEESGEVGSGDFGASGGTVGVLFQRAVAGRPVDDARGAHQSPVKQTPYSAGLSFTTSPPNTGVVLARHHREPGGAGVIVGEMVHVAALEKAVLGALGTGEPCNRKARRPPSQAALAHCEAITITSERHHGDRDVVVGLAVWAAAASTRQVAP